MSTAATQQVSRRLPRFWIRLLLGILLFAVVAGAGAAAYFLLKDDSEAPLVTTLAIELPNGWRSVKVSDEELSVGVLVSLQHDDPPASFLARAVPGRPAQPFDIETLGAEIEGALASEITGFELVSRTTTDTGPFEAVQLYYRQQDEEQGEYQAMMLVIPTEKQTFYLSIRALANDFPTVEGEGQALVDSTVAYLDGLGLSTP